MEKEEEEEFLSTFLPSSLLLKRRLTFDERPSSHAGSGTHIPEVEIHPHGWPSGADFRGVRTRRRPKGDAEEEEAGN